MQRLLLKVNKPEYLLVADKPLRLGGVIKKVRTEDFEKERKIVIDNSIYDSKNHLKTEKIKDSITGSLSKEDLIKQIKQVIKEPRADLVLCDMGKLGLGMFAGADIPKNTVLFIFGGDIMPNTVEDSKNEGLDIRNSNLMLGNDGTRRPFATFMQHLSASSTITDVKKMVETLQRQGIEASELEIRLHCEFLHTEFKHEKTKQEVATTNTRQECVVIGGIPVMAVVTDRLISKGDQIGTHYGFKYFHKRFISPEFFDHDGNVIDERLYKKTFGQLALSSNFSFVIEYDKVIKRVKRKEIAIDLRDPDGEDFAVSTKAIKQALTNAKALYPHESKALDKMIPVKPDYSMVIDDDSIHQIIEKNPKAFQSIAFLRENIESTIGTPKVVTFVDRSPTDNSRTVIKSYSNLMDTVRLQGLFEVMAEEPGFKRFDIPGEKNKYEMFIDLQWIQLLHKENPEGLKDFAEMLGEDDQDLLAALNGSNKPKKR